MKKRCYKGKHRKSTERDIRTQVEFVDGFYVCIMRHSGRILPEMVTHRKKFVYGIPGGRHRLIPPRQVKGLTTL
ncbi:hypothetical protein PP304_gp189 [Gordonia phage Phendrix]|uniref:Uncharacterized protein n=2 Tax=Godonkavirus TaxID=2733178 RepID=A0A4D6E279_9CAUD|nr:hypothetical protein HOV33_gp193 [Gordonia phage GodonK]YP_010649178.1 hypothetical protein PP304_gp189 [Gordonia phage Phendrix]QBZ72763.1 hypothetical protein SEA_GODONK_175 [Gordonia phage GodonK]QDK02681.1 hypothetical protein SEA_PHENDRIX_164 [Gordonia phage Phendrix]